MNKEDIISAIVHLTDEEHQLPLTDLGLIRDIMIRGDYAALTVTLSTDMSDKQEWYKDQIVRALSPKGITDVHVRFKEVSPRERQEIVNSRLNKPAQPPVHKAPAMPAYASIVSEESGIRFIAVASGKGGVGKSTVTVNLAAALARSGQRVGVIDADIYGHSIPSMMNIEERPQKQNNRIMPIEREGLQVISTGFFVAGNKPVVWRGPMLAKMFTTFLNEVEWGPLDIIVIDLPPGTGDIALDVHQRIPHCAEILVTTPHPTAQHVASRAGEMARQTNHPILGVVENMSYFTDPAGIRHDLFGRGGGAALAKQMETELLAQIPLRSLGAAQPDEAETASSVYPEHTEQRKIFDELAEKVLKQLACL
ncbi:Mrp/NBP35 family ATP-binding protein [Paenibacillus sp. FJAT-26967]|uniref:Mrp/NBP35 family ATP-binding protein n=1 Tax=Paenibacillus sp. FJAT-26967 TaxID=1729690 RepID=UPI000838A0D3|nr:Mrp/NBP35 family ATP-binding protein [Paenibacillus sp. FJAT-26967]